MNNLEAFEIKKETLDKNIEIVREKTKEIYQQEKGATPEQILEIKKGLGKIPNLVINFDETMTAKDTVIKVLDYLMEELPEMTEEINKKQEKFIEIIKQYKSDKKEGKKSKINPIKYFYENTINDININNLNKVYDRIIEETELNPNLEKAFEYLKKELKIKTIPLFILSLNNKDLIKKFYQKNSEFFKKHNVEIIDIIGNQIKTNENGQIVDVYEHVTDQNKKEYIPSQAIMLADDRETKDLTEKGVNVVNARGEKYKNELLHMSARLSDIKRISKLYDSFRDYLELKNLVEEIDLSLKTAKIGWENNVNINQLLINIEETDKLVLMSNHLIMTP